MGSIIMLLVSRTSLVLSKNIKNTKLLVGTLSLDLCYLTSRCYHWMVGYVGLVLKSQLTNGHIVQFGSWWLVWTMHDTVWMKQRQEVVHTESVIRRETRSREHSRTSRDNISTNKTHSLASDLKHCPSVVRQKANKIKNNSVFIVITNYSTAWATNRAKHTHNLDHVMKH